MKIAAIIGKILAAVAAIAGAVYLIATYGDAIVAWQRSSWAAPAATKSASAAKTASAPAKQTASAAKRLLRKRLPLKSVSALAKRLLLRKKLPLRKL